MSSRHLFRWTRRNEDKPHRCPNCHAIAARAWFGGGYGPRTILTCCGLKWRVGNRAGRDSMRDKQRRLAHDYSSCACCR